MKLHNREAALRFIFITPCVGESFFSVVRKGMQDAAETVNAQCEFIGTDDVDIDEQLGMVRDAIEHGYNGIALSIIHPTAFESVIDEALTSGIPVVAFNVNARGTEDGKITQVCQDVYQAGKVLATTVYDHVPRGGTVLVTMHSEGISALDDRFRGIKDGLSEKKIEYKTLVTGIDPEKAAAVIGEFLQKHPDIKTVLATGQADTEGAGIFLETDLARDGYFCAGFDLSPRIIKFVKEGTAFCTIDQQPYLQGFYPVVQLAHFLRLGLKPADIDSGAALITQENADAVAALCEAGYR